MAGRKKKNNKHDYSTSQLLNYAPNSYLERTSRPVYAIVFLLPFIVFYEIGTILINTDLLNRSQIRVVAFVWLQQLLEYFGTSSRIAWIAPPLVVILILVGLQLASRKGWHFNLGDYIPMVIECTLLAVPLIVLSLFFNGRSGAPPPAPGPDVNAPSAVVCPSGTDPVAWTDPAREPALRLAAESENSSRSLMANIVTGVGAGIYEELVFRLILICLLMMFFQDLIGLSHSNAIVSSVLISAALFSAHHHIVFLDGQLGRSAPFNWTEFSFRTMAGVYFAGLFALRGFGITAGTHAFYDIIATLLNALFFDH